jgi:hypothetical protein
MFDIPYPITKFLFGGDDSGKISMFALPELSLLHIPANDTYTEKGFEA